MRATIPQRATETPANQTHDCPLCACGAETMDDIYCHLLVAHRKSEITDALLSTADYDG